MTSPTLPSASAELTPNLLCADHLDAISEQFALPPFDNLAIVSHNSNNTVGLADTTVIKVYTTAELDQPMQRDTGIPELYGSELPVAPVIATDTSRSILPYPYAVFERLPGQALEISWSDTLPEGQQRRLYADLGANLALIHSVDTSNLDIATTYPLHAGYASHHEEVEARIDEVMQSVEQTNALPPTVVRGVRSYMKQGLRTLSAVQVGRQLLHGNYRFGNILAQDGAITGIIDWEGACVSAPEEEVANCLYRTVPTAYQNDFLDAYRRQRALPAHLESTKLLYPLLYYMRFLPDIPQWEQFPGKQAYYRKEIHKVISEALQDPDLQQDINL